MQAAACSSMGFRHKILSPLANLVFAAALDPCHGRGGLVPPVTGTCEVSNSCV